MFREATALSAALSARLRGESWWQGCGVGSLGGAPAVLVQASELSPRVVAAVAQAAGPRPRAPYVLRAGSRVVVGDVVPDLGQAETMARVVRTDRYLEAVGDQYFVARKTKHISDDAYKSYAAFWGEWRAYSQTVHEEGVSLLRAAEVSAQADHAFARGKQFQQQLQKDSPGDVSTPIPPDAPPPQKGLGEAVSDVAKAVTVVAVVGGAVLLLSTFRRN